MRCQRVKPNNQLHLPGRASRNLVDFHKVEGRIFSVSIRKSPSDELFRLRRVTFIGNDPHGELFVAFLQHLEELDAKTLLLDLLEHIHEELTMKHLAFAVVDEVIPTSCDAFQDRQ